jgi:hypothetical protein
MVNTREGTAGFNLPHLRTTPHATDGPGAEHRYGARMAHPRRCGPGHRHRFRWGWHEPTCPPPHQRDPSLLQGYGGHRSRGDRLSESGAADHLRAEAYARLLAKRGRRGAITCAHVEPQRRWRRLPAARNEEHPMLLFWSAPACQPVATRQFVPHSDWSTPPLGLIVALTGSGSEAMWDRIRADFPRTYGAVRRPPEATAGPN